MLLYMNNYKGKHFVLSDEPDDLFGDIGTMKTEDISEDWLSDHIDDCIYYGIPAYVGGDKELRGRVTELMKTKGYETNNL
jgi:hypothetical protein